MSITTSSVGHGPTSGGMSESVSPAVLPRGARRAATPMGVDMALFATGTGLVHLLVPALWGEALAAGAVAWLAMAIATTFAHAWGIPIRPFVRQGLKALAISLLLLLPVQALLSPVTASLAFGLAYGGLFLAWRAVAYPEVLALPETRVLLVGQEADSQALQAAIASAAPGSCRLLGYVDDAVFLLPGGEADASRLGGASNLAMICERLRPDAIVVSARAAEETTAWEYCLAHGLRVLSMPAFIERASEKLPAESLPPAWFAHALSPLSQGVYPMIKRGLDILVAVIGLAGTALLLPLLALAIKLGGGAGPVFYGQERVGVDGRIFRIYKFRTMRQDAEKAGATWAAEKDPRVTPVGQFLRQTRLDELPQFWNVLKGEMSVVGPRPERPEFVQVLAREIPYYHCRHWVLPGLTGWAQVKFPYGASVDDARGKHQYDLYYLKNRSLWLDLKTMAMTVGVMIHKVGAR